MVFADGYEPSDVTPSPKKEDDNALNEQDRELLLDIFNSFAERFNHVEETKAYIETFIACVNKLKPNTLKLTDEKSFHALSLINTPCPIYMYLNKETGNLHLSRKYESNSGRLLADIALEETNVCFTGPSSSGKIPDHALISKNHMIAEQDKISVITTRGGVSRLMVPAHRAIPILKKVFAYYLSSMNLSPEIKTSSMHLAKNKGHM